MNEKWKSRKFIGTMIWQLYMIGGFAVMFIHGQIYEWFNSVVQTNSIIVPSYLVVQGIQDLENNDSGIKLSSRKIIVMAIVFLYPLVGYILDVRMSKIDPNFGSLSFLDDLFWCSGLSVATFMGIAWKKK